ncbi:MAG: SPFH domain-containing protein [Firmicutes bacterium]|nr:SPFH domain-containing protein [Bacillota bacterium]MDH7496074.1 SPFH domain-containing protein [Bacillota bacterium]
MAPGLREVHTVVFWFVAAWWGLWAVLALMRGSRSTFALMLVLGVAWGACVFGAASEAGSIALALVPVPVLPKMLRTIPEYKRGVLFRFGRLAGVLDPGLNVILPFGIDKVWMVDLRTFTVDVPKQEAVTRDNVPVAADAAVYFNVCDPSLAVTKVANHVQSIALLGQAVLRAVLGQHELDFVLSNRAELNNALRSMLNETASRWGLRISAVEVKAVELTDAVKRVIAKQAEAERERKARVTLADGELQASERLCAAALMMAGEPAALQLRYVRTITDIAAEKNSTVLFPLPVELLRCLTLRRELQAHLGRTDG